MRILFYAHSSTLYGANSSLINLISGLKKLRPELEMHLVLPSNSDLELILQTERIQYSVLPNKNWVYNNFVADKWKRKSNLFFQLWYWKNKFQKFSFNRWHLFKHIKFAKIFKPDLIYINSSLAPMGIMVSNRLKAPYFWHHRETLNDPLTGFFLENNSLFKEEYQKAYYHIYPSNFLKKSFKKFGYETKYLVSYNGVHFINKERLNVKTLKNNSLKFGVVGRLDIQKDQEQVIEVFKNLILNNTFTNSKPELEIFGEGENSYVEYLKQLASIPEIKFHGFLPKHLIFEDLDYLIINSKNESFGRVVAEANYYGVPVIAIRSGALNEIVISGKNGYTFNSEAELFEILKRLSTAKDINYSKLSKESRLFFENNFSIEAHASDILEAIDKLYQ